MSNELQDRIELCNCRVCGKPTEGWGLEGIHLSTMVRVQAWCPEHCLEEFEEHDMVYEDGTRYCKRCSTAESEEDTDQWLSDQAADMDNWYPDE